MRFFEKISFEQFKKDIFDSKSKYEELKLPMRSTINSAGYDFFAIDNVILKPGEIKKIPSGIKVKMNQQEVLLLFIRSSMGFKYNVRMCNQVGIIDQDYYNNIDNEGHIWISLQNEGSNDYIINAGDKICQGIFINYLLVDNEEKIKNLRKGGIGSTTEEE